MLGDTGTDNPDDPGDRDSSVLVERVEDLALIAEMIDEYSARTKRELLSGLPGGPFSAAQLRSSWDQDISTLRRGVAVRAVYQTDTARVPETLSYLAELAAEGAQIRVSPAIANRSLIFDRTVAVVATALGSPGGSALFVREPVMVRSLFKEFEMLWKSSHSVGVGAESALEVETVRQTLEILRSGLTDEAAARQLAVSVRTVRRRVAAVLDLLGASTRFEAGVRAVEAGWL